MTEQIDKAKREEIQKSLEFNEQWWSDVQEGEPIAQDEIEEVKELLAHNRLLLSSEQAAREEIERLKERLKGIGVEEFLALQQEHKETIIQLNQAIEVLKWFVQKTAIDRSYTLSPEYAAAYTLISTLSQEGEKP